MYSMIQRVNLSFNLLHDDWIYTSYWFYTTCFKGSSMDCIRAVCVLIWLHCLSAVVPWSLWDWTSSYVYNTVVVTYWKKEKSHMGQILTVVMVSFFYYRGGEIYMMSVTINWVGFSGSVQIIKFLYICIGWQYIALLQGWELVCEHLCFLIYPLLF